MIIAVYDSSYIASIVSLDFCQKYKHKIQIGKVF